MAKTLIRKVQIRDPYLLSGQVSSGNPIVFSGNVSLASGDFSAPTSHIQSGYFNELTVSGNLISPYLSGLVGQYTSGSGIHVFSSPVDPSGNNLHFYLRIGTGSLTNTFKEFSTQDSVAGWEYLNGTIWQTFPILGLTLDQQQIATVKHTFPATGFDTKVQHYVGVKPIFAGNISGSFYQGAAFYPDTQGYEVTTPPAMGQIYENIDSRYVRKVLSNTTYVASGVSISGLPFFFQTSQPVSDVAIGMAYWQNSTSGLYVYQTNGWNRINLITQLSGVSGISIPVASGLVRIAPLYGTGIQTICQGNDGRLYSSGHQAGSADPLNVNGLSGILATGQKLSVFVSGNEFYEQLASGIRFEGTTITPTWYGTKLYITSNAFTRITGNAGSFLTASGSLSNSGVLHVSGTYPMFASVATGIPPSAPYYDHLQLSYLGMYGLTTPESGNTFYDGRVMLSGSGGIRAYTESRINGSGRIIIAYTGSTGGTTAGGVTGIGINGGPLYTGGFAASGAGGITVTLASVSAGISGIVISGGGSSSTSTTSFMEFWNTIGY